LKASINTKMKSSAITPATIMSCSLFNSLSKEEVELVSKYARLDMVLKKDVISTKVNEVQHVYVIRKGFMKVIQQLTDSSEVVVELIGPGEFYGRTSSANLTRNVLSQSPDYAEAVEDTSIIAFTLTDFESLISQSLTLQQAVFEQLNERATRMRERLSDIAFRSVKSRLCSILLRHGLLYGDEDQGEVHVRTKLSHQDIGYLIGVSRQTVTSTLNELRAEGLIDFTRKEFVLKNPTAMKELASV
jgi:CRP-like cAMP-binding protein